MSFWEQIEADYNAVISSADSVATKLESLVGIQTRAKEMTALVGQVTAVIEDAAKSSADKVTEILTLVGKL